MIRAGLVSVTYRKLTLRQIVDLARSCGLAGIEWGGDVHVRGSSEAREARTMTEDSGLTVAAFGSYWRAESEFAPILDVAVALNAPTVRVWAGSRGSRDAENRQSVVRALRAACELASAAGRTVSLEYHDGTLTDTLDSASSLAQEIDHPALRLYWQPVPCRSHEERRNELRTLRPWLSNLHVFQWTRHEGETRRHPLAEGASEWPDYLRTTAGDRFALLEFVPHDDPALLSREAKTLLEWIAQSS